VKTTHSIFAFISTVGLIVLWAFPILTSEQLDAGWLAIDFCILVGTYLMLAYPGLFGFMARRNKQLTCRAMA